MYRLILPVLLLCCVVGAEEDQEKAILNLKVQVLEQDKTILALKAHIEQLEKRIAVIEQGGGKNPPAIVANPAQVPAEKLFEITRNCRLSAR